MELRPYQTKAINETYAAWAAGAKNVCLQLATGGGKTVIFSTIMGSYAGYSIAIAHRVELVSQISLTLARAGIRHNIIAQRNAIRDIVNIHVLETGQNYYAPNAPCVVAGVDTLIKLSPQTPWFSRVGLVVQDEGHHPLKANKWGKAAALFPNAVGLYPTATPVRADGRGLGRHADGIHDSLIMGVGMRELIDDGYLSDYRIFAPPSDIDLSQVTIAAGGDFSPVPLRKAVHRSSITGDVVSHYLKIAPGKRGITFAVDIEAATEITKEFREAGVKAEIITGKTPDMLRTQIMRRFRNGEITQLVNVDILGEGVDVPAIEVVSMARPTTSFGLYSQQFGRGLRAIPGKSHTIIIDHVGNVMRHGLPDAPRVWTLDRRERRSRGKPDDVIPVKTCVKCLFVYSRTKLGCPECGYYAPPSNRSAPEFVDGDLTELDPSVLRRLRGEIERIDSAPMIPCHAESIVQMSIAKQHRLRQEAQTELRKRIAAWAGYRRDAGLTDAEIYREFYLKHKIDIATAQTLNLKDALALSLKIIDSQVT